MGERDIVIVDLPTLAGAFELIEDGLHLVGKMRRVVVLVSVGRAGVNEKAVGPGLAGGGREPAVADGKLSSKLADDRNLLRGVIMHDRLGVIIAGSLRRLSEIVRDKSAHPGSWSGAGHLRRSKQLRIDVLP